MGILKCNVKLLTKVIIAFVLVNLTLLRLFVTQNQEIV